MIKKAGVYALTVLYLVTAVGFALNLHYCFNQLTSVNINSPVKSCGMLIGHKMKCCHDKHFEVKVRDLHQGKPASFLAGVFGFKLPKLYHASIFLSAVPVLTEINFYGSNSGPPLNNTLVYLKNCVFRI